MSLTLQSSSYDLCWKHNTAKFIVNYTALACCAIVLQNIIFHIPGPEAWTQVNSTQATSRYSCPSPVAGEIWVAHKFVMSSQISQTDIAINTQP